MTRRLLTTLFIALLSIPLLAQSGAKQNGLTFVQAKLQEWGLKQADIDGTVVSDMYTDAKTGITYLYLQQVVNGAPIHNAVTTLVIKGEKVSCIAPRFVQDVQGKVVKAAASVSASRALQNGLTHYKLKGEFPTVKRSEVNGEVAFGEMVALRQAVKATKKYIYQDEKLIPVWAMNISPKKSADNWIVNVSMVDGQVVSEQNLTIYCNHETGKYNKQGSAACNHPSHSHPVNMLQPISGGATYKAFSFPVESPIHGSISTFSDQAYTDASPYGWHDINGEVGPEYTITRGNNVHAFLDKNDSDSSSGDEPDGGTDLVFNFPYDLNNEAEINEKSSVVNLFTANNQLHDILYRLGFDEQSGNFQQNNYGKGGKGGDYVRAHAFDGFTQYIEDDADKINNANFFTPADGSSGVMQMYLWTNSGGFISIDEPNNISGFIGQVGRADFGNPLPTKTQDPLMGEVVLARIDNPAQPTEACSAISNAGRVAGNIALVDRGFCDFSKKALEVQKAGAIACLICNIPETTPGDDGNQPIGMRGGVDGPNVTIPSIMLGKSECDKIRAEIAAGNRVTMTWHERDAQGPAYRDGSFDNGIIAHELGHGLSNRLIGGPSQAGCLSSAQQAGEGISDFVSLLLTAEEGDTRDDVRGIGNYAVHLSNVGPGIRTYPYTTDYNKNPRNYSELPGFVDAEGDPRIYLVGELWTSMMWDVFWNIADKKGIDNTWTDETAGNYIVGKLFIQGMKMAPCNPTILEMRDAVLAADEILYGGEHELELWSAFAKRGAGYGAKSGPTNSLGGGEASFEVYPLAIKELKLDKLGSGLVEAGEEVEVTLIAKNHVPETKTGVIVKDELPEGAVFVEGSANYDVAVNGKNLTFTIGDMEYVQEDTIRYKITVSEGTSSESLYFDNIDDGDESTYEYVPIEGFNLWTQSESYAKSKLYSMYAVELADAESDQIFQMNGLNVAGDRPVLRFWHRYDTEPINDGGFVTISTDGVIFNKVNDDFIRNGYNSNLNYSTFAIPELQGFSGSSNKQWIDSYIDLSDYAGQEISVRFRFGCNDNTAADVGGPGWYVDDVELIDLNSFGSFACISSSAEDDEQCSNPLEMIVNATDAVNTDDPILLESLEIHVGPNPTSNYFTVDIRNEKSIPLQLALTSIDGKHIATQYMANSNHSRRTFDTSQLGSGLYILSIRSENKVIATRKIVVE